MFPFNTSFFPTYAPGPGGRRLATVYRQNGVFWACSRSNTTLAAAKVPRSFPFPKNTGTTINGDKRGLSRDIFVILVVI